MNIFGIIAEIGILETLRVVSQSPECMHQFAASLPLVSHDFLERRIKFLSDSVIATGKKKLFMMSPEMALLEQLVQSEWNGTAILALPSDLDEESRERIVANFPDGIHIEYVNEGTYPVAFRPDNGVIVCTGIVPPGGHRQYLIPASCRLTSLYKIFQGERVLLSCCPQGTKVPESGWTYSELDYFTKILQED